MYPILSCNCMLSRHAWLSSKSKCSPPAQYLTEVYAAPQSLAILEAAYGAADVRLAAALHNVGGFYVSQRDYAGARPYYQRALKVCAHARCQRQAMFAARLMMFGDLRCKMPKTRLYSAPLCAAFMVSCSPQEHAVNMISVCEVSIMSTRVRCHCH